MYYKVSGSAEGRAVPAYHEGEGVFRTWPLFDESSRLPVKVQVWELPPGASEGSHVHEGEDALEEVYYFVEGEGSMWADGVSFPVRAGDAVMAPPGSDHGFRNTGVSPLKLLIVWGRVDGG